MPEPVRIDGLREFTRALKTFDAKLPTAVRIGLNDAVNVIIEWARPRVAKRTGRAASTLKAKSTRTSARIAAGGSKAPYYPWLDFGGRVGRNRSVERPFYKEGRYIYKGLVMRRDAFESALQRALVGVAESAGLDVD